MAANNEIGVLQPLAEISAIAHAQGALFHVDAAQAVGKVPIDVECDGHRSAVAHGTQDLRPQGVRGRCSSAAASISSPCSIGGGHERGIRAGTLNVPGIVGLGRACAIGRMEMNEEHVRTTRLRDRLLAGLSSEIGGVVVNGTMDHRLPNNLHVTFGGVDGESLLIGIGDIAVSSGSACNSASATPSHVLTAIMGREPVPSASIRFGLGRFTTEDEITYAIEKFATVVRHLRHTEPAGSSF